MPDKIPNFSLGLLQIISKEVNFAGGKRHYNLVKEILPSNYNWEFIKIPISEFMATIEAKPGHWIIFASGDPLFFGIANTLNRELPNAKILIYPNKNSLQMLGHKLLVNYGEYQMVTLTGRPWKALDKVLINRVTHLGILTDLNKTPKAIAQRMLDAGITNYTMQVGECLGANDECIYNLSIETASKTNFKTPNCLFLKQTETSFLQKGINETYFETLAGRPNMITKMPFRIATLSYMNLHNKTVFWDIGACSGSVSIEAKLNYPHLTVISFEIRPECIGIINRNIKKFKVPGIETKTGDFIDVDKSSLPKPDAIFLGGYGGKMNEILNNANLFLENKGILAFNSVSKKSTALFINWITQNSYSIIHKAILTLDENNPIQILIAEKHM